MTVGFRMNRTKKALCASLLLFTACLLFASCKERVVAVDGAPRVRIVSPLPNQAVSDTVPIEIGVENFDKVLHLELLIDQALVSGTQFSAPPYIYKWRTSVFADSTVHSIQAIAYNGSGNGYRSEAIAVISYRFMPTYVSATVLNDSTVRVDWNDNCRFETGYEVYMGDAYYGEYTLAATTAADTNRAYITGRFLDTRQYYFKVRGLSSNGPSNFSSPVSAYFLLSAPPIKSVTTVADTLIEIRWTDNNSFETGYEVSVDNGTPKTLPKNSTAAAITGNFKPNIYHTATVKALKGGSSPLGNSVSFPLPFLPPDSLKILPGTENTVTLSWIDRTAFEKTFRIERRASDASQFSEIAMVDSNVSRFTDIPPDTNKLYTYRVLAVSHIGNTSGYSSMIDVSYVPALMLQSAITFPYSMYEMELTAKNTAYRSTGYAFNEYDPVTGALLRQFPRFTDSGYSNCMNPRIQIGGNFGASDHYRSYSGSPERNVFYLWNFTTGALVGKVVGLYSMIPVGFTNDNSSVIISSGGFLYVYNTTTLQLATRISKPSNSSEYYCESVNRFYYVSGTSLSAIQFPEGAQAGAIPVGSGGRVFAVSPSGAAVLTWESPSVKAYDFPGATLRASVHSPAMPRVALVDEAQNFLLFNQFYDVYGSPFFSNKRYRLTTLSFEPQKAGIIGNRIWFAGTKNFEIYTLGKGWRPPAD